LPGSKGTPYFIHYKYPFYQFDGPGGPGSFGSERVIKTDGFWQVILRPVRGGLPFPIYVCKLLF
jgi:hypothetical protein